MSAKKTKTPGETLNQLIEEYQTNAFSLSKTINVNYQTILNILKGSNRITIQTAFKLGKYFGQSPDYWIELQIKTDILLVSNDKKFMSALSKIPKALKAKAKTASKTKLAGKTTKRKSLAEKRKTAAKVPGSRPAKGKPH